MLASDPSLYSRALPNFERKLRSVVSEISASLLDELKHMTLSRCFMPVKRFATRETDRFSAYQRRVSLNPNRKACETLGSTVLQRTAYSFAVSRSLHSSAVASNIRPSKVLALVG